MNDVNTQLTPNNDFTCNFTTYFGFMTNCKNYVTFINILYTI